MTRHAVQHGGDPHFYCYYAMNDSPNWVTTLIDPSNTNADQVGGKAAHLSELASVGLPVPTAFVISVDAFHSHFPGCSPTASPEAPEITSALAQQLFEAFDQLVVVPGQTVAVRSSAVGEDGATSSFAGQHATYYYITRNALAEAVVNCWLSLWAPHALAYRKQHAANPTDKFGMGVIMQRMVQAESSGVCFTQDPTDQFPKHALVEATWGLGAALVDGRVSPDRFFVAADGAIRGRRIGRKRFKVAENLANSSSIQLDNVSAQQRLEPAITDDHLQSVVKLARRAEQHYNTPQDVEWAIEKDALFLLQSRPITTRINTRAHAAVDGRWVLFKPIVENFHEPLTPMTVDLFRRALPPLGRFIFGRYYLDFNQMKRLLPLKIDDATLAELLLLRGTAPNLTLNWLLLPAHLAIVALAYLSTGITWHRTAWITPTSLWQFAKLSEQVKNHPKYDALSALHRLTLGVHPLEPIGHRIFQTNISAARYFILLEVLKRFLDRFVPSFDLTALDQICTGDEDMLSRQIVERVHNLAELAKGDSQLEAILTRNPMSEVSRRIGELPGSHRFAVALEEFLTRFGHRCAKELDLMTPRWREDPMSVLAMARNYLGFDAAKRSTETHSVRLAALDQLHQALRSRWQRWVVDYLIARIRYYITLRENTRHFHTLALDVLRSKLKHQEQRLLDRGQLKCADDIFFLTWDEANALEQNSIDWREADSVIKARRRKYQEQSRSLPPSTINVAMPPPNAESLPNQMIGQCASRGYAEGTIRVILDPSQAANLNPGEILVAPYTDPAWTPMFPSAAAIVVEVGSYLSHAGTVAREYQIPCLVDVANCTTDLESGQRVRVFATEGRLEVLS